MSECWDNIRLRDALELAEQRGLFPHGIQSERSTYRAHIAFGARMLVCFPRRRAVAMMDNYPLRSTVVDGQTLALGYCVTWRELPGVRWFPLTDDELAPFQFLRTTSEKGRAAVQLFLKFYFGKVVTDVQLQRKGCDVFTQWGFWEVKFDQPSQKNVYLQIAERNPQHQY